MTHNPEQLLALAEKWEAQAAREKARRCWVTASQARQCADELRRTLASPGGGVVDVPHQECYSDDYGDTWLDCHDDAAFVSGLNVGDTYTLQVSHYSIERKYRVTKVPDDVNDDYEVELVQDTAALERGDADL